MSEQEQQVAIGNHGQVIIPNEFPAIKVSELLPGDCVLFIYGNKLTELHGHYRDKNLGRSTTPPYHAAMVYDLVGNGTDATILDPVAITELQSISKYMGQATKRIDIVRYNLTDNQRYETQAAARDLIKHIKGYDVKGYGAFLSQMPFFGWVKYIVKPSEKLFYCSDAVTYCIQDRAGYKISQKDHNFTAPVDLQLFAMERPSQALLYTLKQAEGK